MEVTTNPRTKTTCHEKIHISRAGLPTDWEIENADYICDSDSAHFFIDDERFESKERLIEWLKINSAYIDFEQTKSFILQSHVTAPCLFETTFGDISNVLGARMSSYNYNSYLKIEIIDDEPCFDSVDDFIDDGSCFSIPLLKAIIDKHQISDTDTVHLGMHEKGGFYFRVVDTSSGAPYFYNISKDPKSL